MNSNRTCATNTAGMCYRIEHGKDTRCYPPVESKCPRFDAPAASGSVHGADTNVYCEVPVNGTDIAGAPVYGPD